MTNLRTALEGLIADRDIIDADEVRDLLRQHTATTAPEPVIMFDGQQAFGPGRAPDDYVRYIIADSRYPAYHDPGCIAEKAATLVEEFEKDCASQMNVDFWNCYINGIRLPQAIRDLAKAY